MTTPPDFTLAGFLLAMLPVVALSYSIGRAVERDAWRMWLCAYLRMNYCDVMWVEPDEWVRVTVEG
jgi:hypothetical protein